MHPLADFFTQSGFNATEQAQILAAFVKKDFSKGEFFVQEGRTNRHLGFVATGLLQYFFVVDGVEKTTYVVGANGFAVSLVSFFKQVPARENIRALTDSTVWMVDKTQLETLIREIPAFKDFYIALLEGEISCIDDSRLNLLTQSAEQRYLKLLNDEPQLLQQIPLQHLASILGVTPRHLSRIRNNIR